MIAYLARVIPAFVMYCVNGAFRSSLLIESTDSMIIVKIKRNWKMENETYKQKDKVENT